MATSSTAPLQGLKIVELSSFVASPLCGLTLSQLGAQVIRIDPPGGAADVNRWPVTVDGNSIYWTGLNKGKHSVVADLHTEAGQDIVRRLITEPSSGGGIVVTNTAGRQWLSHNSLQKLRPDVITVEIVGNADGRPAVDYTVNAAVGFPAITGPTNYGGVVNHVLPAWDVACGLYAALAVVSAVRRRDQTGVGCHIRLALHDMALFVASTLGYLTEVQVNGTEREATGNDVYGTYGTDFSTSDDARFMLVALTSRHFRSLVDLTGTREAVTAIQAALGVDLFNSEADRFRHRQLLHGLFNPWFRSQPAAMVETRLADAHVLFARYRTFTDVVNAPDVQDNPLFANLDQPLIGSYLAAGSPATFDGTHFHATAASRLGADTGAYTADASQSDDEH
ncbi:mesaconyl-CoA isomerase [Mycolicibacterium mucogenicum]|uniref:Mesaconyl-CoA isomerase n=1 Tax=Mycolicibacterium mucogenicum TaxID=56689 RepID=A0A1A3HFH6_MYCMU|nr:CoA transferase [Mycolicibacterium mucogenicum]OBJ46439.1 mesaconyl-CoA isomerase [Mycolicibacterium mucogenicum]